MIRHETLTDVLEDLRKWGTRHFARSAKIREFCDRARAAWERESKAIATEHAVLPAVCITKGGDAAAREMIATPAEGMPPKRDAHRGAHPETAESCLGTGEVENGQTVQIGEISGGGRAEAKPATATAGAVPVPAKSLVNAAWKREECSRRGAEAQSGNAAKLREALEQLSDKVCDYLQKGLIQLPLPIEGLLKQARDALAAPARQCDVGTAEEQEERFRNYCWNHSSRDKNMECRCPIDEGKSGAGCKLTWAQMPYEADESEVGK